MTKAAEPESRLLREIRSLREQFVDKYNRGMTDEEKRALKYAEKLLKASAAKKQVSGA